MPDKLQSTIQESIPSSIATSLPNFIGRDWVFQRLNSWLETGQSRIFLLQGAPGSGKSTLAARCVQITTEGIGSDAMPELHRDWLTYAHFCQAQLDTTLSPHRFVEVLSQQLAKRYSPFAEILLERSRRYIHIETMQNIGIVQTGGSASGVVIHHIHIDNNFPVREAFDQCVRQPLDRLYADNVLNEPLVILIDALDEAWTYHPMDNIVVLLQHAVLDLPPSVRFLLTSRPDQRIARHVGSPTLDLVVDAPEQENDVQIYVSRRLSSIPEPKRALLTDQITRAARRNFLYAHNIVEEVLTQIDQQEDLLLLDLPKSLEDIYYRFLQRELGYTLENWDRYHPLLGTLAIAYGEGLTRHQLAGATERKLSEVDMLLRACSQYLIGQGPDGPFRLYHQSFRDFLLAERSDYRVYAAEAHDNIVNFFLRAYVGNWLACEDRYALQYLSRHLLDAWQTAVSYERTQKTEALLQLWSDIEFIEIKTAYFGIDSLLSDLRAVLNQLPPALTQSSDLPQMLHLLDTKAHLLRRWQREQQPAFFTQHISYWVYERNLPLWLEAAQRRLDALSRPHLELLWRIGPESPFLRRTLQGHNGWVTTLVVTPDGQRAISGSMDGTLRVWDLDSGRTLSILSGHSGEIMAMALSPDGRYIISTSTDRTVKVWDLTSGQAIFTFKGHTDWVPAVTLTPDGLYAISGSADTTMRVWDLTSGQLQHVLQGHAGYITAIIVVPISAGLYIISASSDHTLKIWDLERGGRPLATLKGHTGEVTALALAPDGRRVISASKDHTLRVWNLLSRRLLATLEGHTGEVTALALAPDGRQVISTSRDHTLKIWDLDRRRCLATLRGHTGGITALAPNSQRVVSASKDGTLRVWDCEHKQLLSILRGHSDWVRAVACTPDDRWVVSASDDGTVKMWDLAHEQLTYTKGHSDQIRQVALSSDGRAISGSVDGLVNVWDLSTAQILYEFKEHHGPITALALSAEGQYVVSAAEDGTVKVWNPIGGQSRYTFKEYTGWTHALALTPDGSRALCASTSGTITIWNLFDGQLLSTLEGHTGWIRAIALFSDGLRAVSASSDGTLRVWDLDGNQLLCTLRGHTGWVHAVMLMPDGQRAISASADLTLRVWDLSLGQTLSILKGHTAAVTALALSPDGQYAISASDDNTLRAWDLAANQILHVFAGHEAPVTAVTFFPNGRYCASISDDGTLRIWDFSLGQEVACIFLESQPTCIISLPSRVGIQDGMLVGDSIGNFYCLQVSLPHS